MKRWICLTGLLLALVLTGCSVSQNQQPQPELILRYADNQPLGHPATEAAEHFGALVERRTQGKIRIRVFPNGELGDERNVMEQVQFGGIDMSRLCMGTLAEFVPEMDVLQMPYLYRDSEHMWRVLDGEIGEDFLGKMEQADVVGLSWFDAGARSFYTREPITRLQDLQGLRIRVQESETMAAMVELLGAVPVQIQYGNVYSAMQTGEIDGADNNWPSYTSAGHYEAARYFLRDEHTRLPEMQIISREALKKIEQVDPEFVDTVVQCARESAAYERELWKLREKESEAFAIQRGCTVTELTPREREQFRRAVQPMYDSQSPEDQEMIARILKS